MERKNLVERKKLVERNILVKQETVYSCQSKVCQAGARSKTRTSINGLLKAVTHQKHIHRTCNLPLRAAYAIGLLGFLSTRFSVENP